MINTRDYFGRPLYLAGTPQPYQGFAPIGEFKPRQQKSAAAQLQSLFDTPSYTPTGSGNGQGTGTGDGTGSGTGTGTNTGTGGGLGGNAPDGQHTGSTGGNSAWDIAIGAWNLGGAPQQGDQPIGYPDWQAVAKAIEWEQEHTGEYGGTGSISEDNPYKPDFTKYPGTPGSTAPSTDAGGGTGSTGGGGSTGNTTSPQFGIGGAIEGYPGVYSPNSPGAVDVINGVGTWKDIISGKAIDPTLFPGVKDLFGFGKTPAVIEGAQQQIVAGPGQAPPVGGELAAGIDKVLGTVGTVLNGKTLLDGDADPIDKIVAGVSLVNPAIGAAFAAALTGLRAIGVGSESSTSKARRGYDEWGAVNNAFLDALGRDAGPSRNMGYYAPGISASNVDDLNFINSFLGSKGLLWGPDTAIDTKDNLIRPGGVKGGELIDMYGNDINRLWGDLTSFYSGYENAPPVGDMPTWGESAKTSLDDFIAAQGGPVATFGNAPLEGSWSPAVNEFLAGFGGSPSNPNYNPYLNQDYLLEQVMAMAYGPDDPWGFNAARGGTESGGWSY